jgi:fumarate hydratase subunit beta
MDRFAPRLYELGVRATVGKGYRGEEVRDALARYGAVHLSATGGAGALLGKCVEKVELLAYEDLGTEAIRRLWVRDFPAVVAYDSHGQSAYPADA